MAFSAFCCSAVAPSGPSDPLDRDELVGARFRHLFQGAKAEPIHGARERLFHALDLAERGQRLLLHRLELASR